MKSQIHEYQKNNFKNMSKKLIFITTLFVTLTAFTTLNGIWKSDIIHSQLGFTVTHLGVADISGTFNDFEITAKSSKADFSDASFELTAKIASIDTRVEARNNHLKTADFFDADQYSTLSFKSTSLKKIEKSKNKYKLAGTLTMHGITKSVILDLIYKGTVENPTSKKQTAGFQINGVIKRMEFGVGSKFPAELISDEVRIKVDGEFVQNE